MNLLRAVGAGFVLICGAFLAIAFRRESRMHKTKFSGINTQRRAG
jgi:hypothetical protein